MYLLTESVMEIAEGNLNIYKIGTYSTLEEAQEIMRSELIQAVLDVNGDLSDNITEEDKANAIEFIEQAKKDKFIYEDDEEINFNSDGWFYFTFKIMSI